MKRWQAVVARFRNLGAKLKRSWQLALATAIVMVGISAQVLSTPVVYYAQVEVLFLIPEYSVQDNKLLGDTQSALYLASVVEKRFNAAHGGSAPQTTFAPLYGTGIRNGHWVHVPDDGGQWQSSFSRPLILVEVVGESPEDVRERLDLFTDEIKQLAVTAQDSMGIKQASRVTTDLWPPITSVSELGGKPSRVKAGMGLLTLIAIGTAITLGDRLNFGSKKISAEQPSLGRRGRHKTKIAEQDKAESDPVTDIAAPST